MQSERLASVGYLAAGVAHEINNPLGIITGHAELALRGLKHGADAPAVQQTMQSLQVICEESFRCKEIIRKLLTLAKPVPGGAAGRERLALAQSVQEVVEMVQGLPVCQGRKLKVEAAGAGATTVLANPSEMRQVILNLVSNALQATAGMNEGCVTLTVRPSGGEVEMVVQDNGRGMTPESVARVFEPFYTQKRGSAAESSGTGLGLSIVHAIVREHGGRIVAQSAGPGRGSCFTMVLPAADG